jgi:hypothetical protein
MNKTLIGKNGYLFLHNDSAREIDVHRDNLDITNSYYLNQIVKIKDNYLLIVFPNKSLYCKNFLPDGYNLQYRPAFNKYANMLTNHIIDGLSIFNSNDDIFYKTDTHMNIKGCIIIYNSFIEKINNLFNLKLEPKQFNLNKEVLQSLSNSGLGIGDLTWKSNLGDQILNSTEDIYYSSNELNLIYCKHKINNDKLKIIYFDTGKQLLVDETENNLEKILDWTIVSKYILYQKNKYIDNKNKILIFYDSFLLSTLNLYLNLFQEVYMSKSILNHELIDIVKPDYVFEFRVERFLL